MITRLGGRSGEVKVKGPMPPVAETVGVDASGMPTTRPMTTAQLMVTGGGMLVWHVMVPERIEKRTT